MVQRNKSSMDYVSLGCCTLAFVLYINTLSAGFVYDDRRAILGNPDVLSTGGWAQMLQNDFWGTPLVDSGSHGSYRPLCVASFKLNYLVDGFKPFGYHLVNVLLHSLATGLVVKLARHILPVSRSGVAITGLLFAAHPIHTEAVAGVVGRADLTGCIFYLLALLAYIRHVRWRQWGDGRQWLALAVTVLLAGAAILCKETAVTALVVCAIYDIIKGYAGSRDKHRVRSLSIIALSLAFIVHCRLTLPRPATLFSTADNPTARSGSLWTRFLTFTYLPVVNFKLLLLPDVLSFDWGMDAIPRIGSVFDRKVALACLFYLALGWAVWSSGRVLARQSSRQTTNSSAKSANGASSFNRKLTNKLNLHRLRTEEGALPVVELTEEPTGGAVGCALCKHDAGLHHSSSCRTLHNNNGMSSIICGCAYAPEYKYLSLAPSTLASYFCRTAGSSKSTVRPSNSNNNNNDSASINYNQSFQGTVGKKFACHWPLGETACLGKEKTSEEHSPFPFATLLTTTPEIASPSRTPSLSSSSFTSSSSSSASSSCASSVRGDSTDGSTDAASLRDGSSLHNSPAAALLMSVALLTLPFLPASNLLFYVGFVVAERILYLPSVGYCLLIGLGVSGLIDGTGVARGHGSSSSPSTTGGAASGAKIPNYGRCNGRRTGGSCWVGTAVRKCMTLVATPSVRGECSVGTRDVSVGDDANGINRMSVNSDNGNSGRYGKFRNSNGIVASGASVVSGSVSSKPSRPIAAAGRSGRTSGRSTKAHGPRRRQLVLACVGLLLIAYSAKTVRRNRDWVDEESLFRSAITVNPPKALGNLGSVLSAQGRYQEAKEALKAALSHRPNMADVHYNLGILLQNQQDYNEAVESFRKAIRFRPSLALAYLNLGTSLIALGRCQEAASVLREGTKLDGSGLRDRAAHDNARISALLQLGNLYADQGKLQRALAVYREALHTLPERYPPQGIYHRLGDIFARLSQWSEAERFQRAALEAQPDHIAAHLSYGTMLARNSSRTSEAEQWFRRALRLAPNDASVHHHYAEFLSSQRRTEEAFQYRVRAAELAPEDYALVMAAASSLRLHDRKLEAERWYRQAVKLRPQEARAHTNLGAILHLLGRTQEAANSYREALRLQPDDLTTLSNLAKLGVPAIS
ncbi:protein O-mannosyl-transferase TMTC2 [Anopheles maculipalpis]|uniref:protein O-mannosyl-transferase TMTC2 n=1 Tax=Anopheles maculipalpis TaxID=1496333 RepID=UPI0021595D95|nr:protein O-mannosyl-transferase TMTC2 [Anopheles maculipalpis]